jgi:hypothetical protein
MRTLSLVRTFAASIALRTEWTSGAGGKPKGAARFELMRKR